jgi:hypothetical protein
MPRMAISKDRGECEACYGLRVRSPPASSVERRYSGSRSAVAEGSTLTEKQLLFSVVALSYIQLLINRNGAQKLG